MEIVIFCGIQATGKTTFYKENFLKSHIRISLDQLNTRNKESKFIETCFDTLQAFVIDNTNPTKEDRAKYISAAKTKKFKVIGYYFQSHINQAILRNGSRVGKEKIPDAGIRGTYGKLELPSLEEGFDELYFVEIVENQFNVKKWQDEI